MQKIIDFLAGMFLSAIYSLKQDVLIMTTGSIFGFVPVTKSVFKGGWGEWEAVLRFSSLDLDDGSIHGGKFWRITPMVNWYMSKAFRTEFIYGYGVLDRYNMKGAVQIFQIRLQLTVM